MKKNTIRWYGFIAVFAAGCWCMPAPAPVYAGEITGTITFEGRAPSMRPIRMAADPVCDALHSEPVLAETLVMGEGQTMANVLVQVTEGLPKGKKYPVPEAPFEFTQAGCMYSPHVFGVRAGQPVKVLNPDGTLHNIHVLSEVNPEFNKAMTKARTEMIHVFEKPEEVFHIKCEVHPWMGAYAAIFDHPFFDVTEKDGKYSITGLEPGTYTIQAWHERLGPMTKEVTVEKDGKATADFTFSRPSRD